MIRHVIVKHETVWNVSQCHSLSGIYGSPILWSSKTNDSLPLVCQSFLTVTRISSQPWHPINERRPKLPSYSEILAPLKFCSCRKICQTRTSNLLFQLLLNRFFSASGTIIGQNQTDHIRILGIGTTLRLRLMRGVLSNQE